MNTRLIKVWGKIVLIVFIISVLLFGIGWLLSSETLFYTGCSLMFFVVPVLVIVFLLIICITTLKE